MKRTDEQISSDYKEFRGKCKIMSEEAVKNDPTLTLVRGYYFCPLWCTEEQHWWTVRADGSIYDPTCRQFPSNGYGIYTEFDGTLSCDNCGNIINEADASIDGRFVFCSHTCHGRFIGIY